MPDGSYNESSTQVTEVPDQQRDPVKDAARIQALGVSLAGKRQKAIDARVSRGIDQRWFEDVEAYEGRDEVTRNYLGLRQVVQGYVEPQDKQEKKRSTLVVNVTRQKVNASSSRLADIALPTDDRNWDLRPSTVPELVEKLAQKHKGLTLNGQPVMVTDGGQQRQATVSDLAQRDMDKAKATAKAMRDEIDDQLDLSDDGCGYEGVIRMMIDSTCLLGVGIIKGPIITSRTKKVWVPMSDGTQTVHKLARIQERKPMSKWVDPWDIYPHPDCGENPKKGAAVWERSRVTASEIRQMADIDGYLKPQLALVLREGPRKLTADRQSLKPGVDTVVDTDTIYDQWEMHGELDAEDLAAAGVDMGPEADPFRTYAGCVVMINDTVVKADIEILDTEEWPYDFYVINRCSGSWAGYGDAFLSRSAQRAITAAWRSMMDNAGQFVGGQIVINRKVITPADGKWELRGMKCWFLNHEGGDVDKAFAVHEIPPRQEAYAAIIKMGMDFLDRETALPQLAEGEQGDATDVLGGMNLLLNASNVMQRRKLKLLDDQVTIPHIGRYVDWNMQYNPNPAIKGDFEVQARASGALMDQAVQDKGAANLLAIAKDPAFAAGIKKYDAVRRVAKALRFQPDDFVYPDAQIQANEEKLAQQQHGDPRVEVAKIKAEADAKYEQMRQRWETSEKAKDRQLQLVTDQINERIEAMKLNGAQEISFDELKAMLAETAMKLNVQKDLSLAGHMTDLHKHHNPPPVIEPPTEPAGRAKPGSAYQA